MILGGIFSAITCKPWPKMEGLEPFSRGWIFWNVFQLISGDEPSLGRSICARQPKTSHSLACLASHTCLALLGLVRIIAVSEMLVVVMVVVVVVVVMIRLSGTSHPQSRFSYSLLKHHGYIDWRTVGMRECYWCTLDITETVGLCFNTNWIQYLVFMI